ncbi:hypothetical protein HOS59_gp51 [Streptomyces phage Rowa]|uniref:Uncharacterized protein n=1 Tax=Streptomyces phage Rowa TaxID=2059883 RepID=A0A2H5BM27_9CAUD|nr:hypothetical protein HOS59_gp51 [Streptomyces phage Rowa]AUG87315.1 hypothetical protein SEA_ROWA_51 [Streptomyces phage Rowa]
MRHKVKVAKVLGIELVEAEEGDYYNFEVEIRTEGNVRQVLSIPHNEADWLRVLIIGEVDSMPQDVRKRSFFGSILRNRRKVAA